MTSAICHLLSAIVLCSLLSGCGPKNFKNDNDQLRAERLELQRRVAELEQQLQQRSGEIAALRAVQTNGAESLPGAGAPVFSMIKLDRYTGPIDSDGNGRDDSLRLYVRTLDQLGRMMPVSARANVQMVELSEGQPPKLYQEKVFEPNDFDAAYRTGLTGTHYTLELSLPPEAPAELTVKVTVTDLTGITHSAQQAFHISNSSPSKE
ncbi:MAG: hypothetical protein IT445_04285 [Phycisphaeraceae bacterium]|nr:hypothetical protein [Phycisphaeraceae bacterium]